MRLSVSLLSPLILLAAGAAQAASSWGFDDGSVAVTSKKGGEAVTEKFTQKSPLNKAVTLGGQDTITVSLTAKDSSKGKRPHQAFVVLKDEETGLEAPFPFTVKEDGKAKVQIAQKDLPVQLLLAGKPLHASVIIASFGSEKGLIAPAFDLQVSLDPNTPAPTYTEPVRYGKKPEIHHIFGGDPRSPPKIVSLFFVAVVLATVPALFVAWLLLGANLNHLPKALGAAPISHAIFFGSIVAMEGVFFLYYSSWNLFQVLPAIGVVAIVTVLSGTKALGEVQSRRLAGER
ncbi:Dolichyl-diphosphooligosaccharide--protein glycosyltransferase subunit 2 [Pleurostoma richardsiae]|uniref:Dolichyl-diphosphooligosaccharide--protein glycosyltransferase subunit 2 n=1 Tax=Pleurostoma richardsiae TaxID=41990 RepID=A0AA38S726_9PEZI|nr:Dolichyl-diphosphooligosaccharide--protein glycosyltransferase subunit 2 [Pleurostoma richardsiae]